VRFVRSCHHIGWRKGGAGLTFGLEDLLVAVVRGHVPGVLGLAVLLFFVELVADGFDEFLAGLLEVGLWSVRGRLFLENCRFTHFESAEVSLEQRLVGSAEVLLHAGLGQAVCDTADESLVSGEGLKGR
jgi:hypothetical protein